MDRRVFLRALPVLSAVSAGALSSTACAGLTYLAPVGTAGRLTVRAADVPHDGALLQRPDMAHPIWVRPDAAGVPTALLLRCTHRGCQPDPVGDRLVCPCHGSEFDTSGAVLSGPAETALTRYPVEIEGDRWTVVATGLDR